MGASVNPAWWENRQRLIARRLREMNYGTLLTERDGLPDGMTIKLVASAYYVWIDGNAIHREQFVYGIEKAAKKLAAWVEENGDNMATGISDKAIELLRELAAAGTVGIARKRLGYPANLVTSLERKQPPMIINAGGLITLTIAGAEYLRGLPEFDTPVPDMGMGDAPQVQEPPFPRISGGNMATGSLGKAIELLRELAAAEGGVTRSTLNYPRSLVKWLEDYGLLVEEDGKLCITPIGGAYLRRPEFDTPINTPHPQPLSQPQERGEEPDALVRVVMADGFGLGDFVGQRCAAEFNAGKVTFYLDIKEALARVLYPHLNAVTESLGMAGLETELIAEMTISLIQKFDAEKVNEIPF